MPKETYFDLCEKCPLEGLDLEALGYKLKPAKCDGPKPVISEKGVHEDSGMPFERRAYRCGKYVFEMLAYIHSKRSGTHIIDLTKTVENLDIALGYLTKTAAEGKQILLVGTKRQAQASIRQAAEATGMPFVTERWLGGMLTNWNTIGGRVKHLQDLENRMASGELANKYNKLEVQRFQEEIDQMNELYGGIKELNARPGAVFIVDIVSDANALREANKMKVPVVALVDTNADPSQVAYPIPANDDAIKTIELITSYVQAAILAGKAKVKPADKPAPEAEKTEKIERVKV
jgi:small subunit ribosomal protein S2